MAKRSPSRKSTMPFSVSFRLVSSLIPTETVSGFEASKTRTDACRRYVPLWSRAESDESEGIESEGPDKSSEELAVLA
jgi:hypothetical protein